LKNPIKTKNLQYLKVIKWDVEFLTIQTDYR